MPAKIDRHRIQLFGELDELVLVGPIRIVKLDRLDEGELALGIEYEGGQDVVILTTNAPIRTKIHARHYVQDADGNEVDMDL